MAVDAIYRDPELGFYFEALHATSKQDPYKGFSDALHTPIFREHFDALPREVRILMLAYLGNCINRKEYSLESLINLAAVDNQEKEEVMMSIAQEYIDKGVQLGMQQGMQQGIQRGTQRGISFTAKNMLDKAFSLDAISSITGLSQAVLKKMQRKGEY